MRLEDIPIHPWNQWTPDRPLSALVLGRSGTPSPCASRESTRSPRCVRPRCPRRGKPGEASPDARSGCGVARHFQWPRCLLRCFDVCSRANACERHKVLIGCFAEKGSCSPRPTLNIARMFALSPVCVCVTTKGSSTPTYTRHVPVLFMVHLDAWRLPSLCARPAMLGQVSGKKNRQITPDYTELRLLPHCKKWHIMESCCYSSIG